jgi:hypothetical protein
MLLLTNCDVGNADGPTGSQPLSICDECFSPLEIVFDLEAARQPVYARGGCPGPTEHVALSERCCPFRRTTSRRRP